MTDTYDVIVLGAGSTGTNVAWYARDNGLTVAVVERELVGGECSYWACMPSKALLGPTHVLATAQRMPGAREAVTGAVDAAAVLARRDELTSHLDDASQVRWLDGIDAELVRGHGRITGEREVSVTDGQGEVRRLTAGRAVVVATGSRAAIPPVEGLRDIRSWDNRDVTNAKDIPRRLLVLGGGVVGVEMAQAFRRLGAEQVTIVQRPDRLVPGFEPWASDLLTAAFTDEGIDVRTGRTLRRVSRDGADGPVTAELDDGGLLSADELLVAVGRSFNTEDIGLERVGLEPGGPLSVDDHLRVTGIDGSWFYAAGDVNGRALLTHQGKYQARLVGDLLAGRERTAWADHTAVPQVVFTDPELAAVGRTAQQARAAGWRVKTVAVDLGDVAGGALAGIDHGRAQLVIDEDERVVVGATFVGSGVGEMLHAATIAVAGRVPIETLWHAVPAYPTVSEVWLRLLEADRELI